MQESARETIVRRRDAPDATAARVAVDRDAFDARFDRVRGRIVAICIALVGFQDADDLLHDTYVRARERIGQLRNESLFEAWVARIAVNECRSSHRRGRRRRDRLSDLAVPDRAAPSADVGLQELVDALPARERATLVLHYGYGYDLKEIAQLLGLGHSNVRTIIHRARKRLRRGWQEADHD